MPDSSRFFNGGKFESTTKDGQANNEGEGGKKREVKPGSLLTPSSADGVVTLVDSKHAMQHLNEVKPRFVVNEAVEQVAYANRIIFNKIDLVGEAELEVLTKKIKHINGIAQIKLAKFGSVDMDFVLGVGGYDLESEKKIMLSTIFHEIQRGCC
ncbi:hypothetical protein CMV_009727 [Castanea mollissima]|uniref:CobW/HypB/UreG nucleotide-binding domain-containing protein n=1 Tax=Castanea mollissima TaxID=60419 RepID=A0A8J4RNX4_9ROSI|nr:hypothetical protein CMV_009727 [Castanea mollissima]